MANEAQNQSYDNLLKRFLENQSTVILPLLFPDLVSEVVEELNIELLVPPRRADRAYRTRPNDHSSEQEIMHIEFESSSNTNMDKRLLVYHALLLEKYNQPINLMIIYPFEVSMVTSPLTETKGSKQILLFEYQTLPLWKLDAQKYVEMKAVPIYGLLPTMQGTSEAMLLRAINDMVQYYGDDQAHLRDELLCFLVLLTRAKRLPEAEFLRVERRVRMFDPLLEEDPWVKEKLAEREQRGELKQARDALIRFIQRRFPSLTDIARVRADRINQLETLNTLSEQLWFASDEYAARALLEASSDAQ